MNDQLLLKLKEHVKNHGGASHDVVSLSVITEAEEELGFELPPLLKACYLEIGNGGFCLHDGVIGMRGGYASDFGDIVETYAQLKSDQEYEGRVWKHGMLPFFEWGCNKFSCVCCTEPNYPIYTFENFGLEEEGFTLDVFFEKWIDGEGDPEQGKTSTDVLEVEIINPFTGEKTTAKAKGKKEDT